MKSPDNQPQFTLITGASAGLGRALAFECGRRGMNLILIALPHDNLRKVANQIRIECGVKVYSFELDLADQDDFNYLLETLEDININWLINNVAQGGTFSFRDVSEHYLNRIIDLNIRSTCLLTHHLLPKLAKNSSAYILNISSLLYRYPTAFKTIYPASKSFIHSFSMGLREELRNTCVSVSVAAPGPMVTNGDVSERIIKKQKRAAKIAIMSPEDVAYILIDKTIGKKALIIPGLINKIYWFIMKITPYRFGIPYLSKIYLREKCPAERTRPNAFKADNLETVEKLEEEFHV